MTLVEIRAALEEKTLDFSDVRCKMEVPPKHLKWVPRLSQEIIVLTELFHPDVPP